MIFFQSRWAFFAWFSGDDDAHFVMSMTFTTVFGFEIVLNDVLHYNKEKALHHIRENKCDGNRPCVSLYGATRTVSSCNGALLCRNIASIRNFSAHQCATYTIIALAAHFCAENAGLQHFFRTEMHCWSTWCTRGALHALEAICTPRCVRAVHNALHLHTWSV